MIGLKVFALIAALCFIGANAFHGRSFDSYEDDWFARRHPAARAADVVVVSGESAEAPAIVAPGPAIPVVQPGPGVLVESSEETFFMRPRFSKPYYEPHPIGYGSSYGGGGSYGGPSYGRARYGK